jgi:ABC-type glycerol-3-phosphate transport system substrate-binding protein
LLLSVGYQFSGERVSGEPVPVSIWMFGGSTEQNAWVRRVVDGFNASQSEIVADFEAKNWATQRESLITSTIAGAGPNIIRVHHMYSVEFGELGGLYALDNFVDFPAVKERVLDNLWDYVSYDDRPYGLPTLVLPFVLAAAGQNGLAWPAHPAITQIQRSMADALNMAMSGALEPQEALDQAAAEVDGILLEY